MFIYVTKTTIRSPLAPLDAYVIVDEVGRTISMAYPTRGMAVKEAEMYADDFSDVTYVKGKPPVRVTA